MQEHKKGVTYTISVQLCKRKRHFSMLYSQECFALTHHIFLCPFKKGFQRRVVSMGCLTFH